MFQAEAETDRGSGKGAVGDSKDSVRPLVRNGIEASIELTHGDGFRVDDGDLYLVLLHQTFLVNIVQRSCNNNNTALLRTLQESQSEEGEERANLRGRGRHMFCRRTVHRQS